MSLPTSITIRGRAIRMNEKRADLLDHLMALDPKGIGTNPLTPEHAAEAGIARQTITSAIKLDLVHEILSYQHPSNPKLRGWVCTPIGRAVYRAMGQEGVEL